jgi:flagellar basal-body rod modification protein FlgD
MIVGDSSSPIATEGTTSAQSAAKLEDDLNKFLTLLVTQLQNQDPLDPMDATEFTSQLVQFASVEQQIYQNTNLEKMLNLQETSQIASMVDFIGNKVEFLGQKLPLENAEAEFSYVIPVGAKDVSVNIADANGVNVFFAPGETTSGKHTIGWDGKDKNGQQLPDGYYTILVSAKDSADKLMQVEHLVTGKVSGAGVDDGVGKLFIGNGLTIEQKDILSVRKPEAALADDSS